MISMRKKKQTEKLRVLNPENWTSYEYTEPKDNAVVLKGLSNEYLVKPYRDPKIDILAEVLWAYPDLLATLLHNKKAYSCYFPVFVDGKVYRPGFLLKSSVYKIMGSVTEARSELVYRREEIEKCLSLAIAKLKGSFYASAGHD